MKALISVGGEIVSVLLNTTPERIEKERAVLKNMYKGEKTTVKIKEDDKKGNGK